MDYSEILHALQGASLFDMYRLRVGINKMLEMPERILPVRQRLRPGMEISYFDESLNKLVDAVVVEIRRTRLTVANKADGKQWNLSFYTVNVDGLDTDIHPRNGSNRLDRNQLKVGDMVGFFDRDNREQYAHILQLNPKTASILTKAGSRWRVAYSLLFKVMDSTGRRESDPGLLEGEIVAED